MRHDEHQAGDGPRQTDPPSLTVTRRPLDSVGPTGLRGIALVVDGFREGRAALVEASELD
jgi:hypothetical protein